METPGCFTFYFLSNIISMWGYLLSWLVSGNGDCWKYFVWLWHFSVSFFDDVVTGQCERAFLKCREKWRRILHVFSNFMLWNWKVSSKSFALTSNRFFDILFRNWRPKFTPEFNIKKFLTRQLESLNKTTRKLLKTIHAYKTVFKQRLQMFYWNKKFLSFIWLHIHSV